MFKMSLFGSSLKVGENAPNFILNDQDGKQHQLSDYRGKKLGGAKVSNLHSNFLINYKNASSLDLEMLGEEIKNKVWEKRRINLKWELIRIGEFKKV